MVKDQLLNELERQEKYLAELPDNFSYPLFNTKRALDSQRQNGYRNTAVAAREIVDNSLEAKATKVHVVFDSTVNTTALWSPPWRSSTTVLGEIRPIGCVLRVECQLGKDCERRNLIASDRALECGDS